MRLASHKPLAQCGPQVFVAGRTRKSSREFITEPGDAQGIGPPAGAADAISWRLSRPSGRDSKGREDSNSCRAKAVLPVFDTIVVPDILRFRRFDVIEPAGSHPGLDRDSCRRLR
jgi:hypothetical protein